MTRVSYKPGETIFLEQESGDALYVVASGKVRVAPRAHLHLVVGLDLVIAENGIVSDLASVSEHEADGLAPADREAVGE